MYFSKKQLMHLKRHLNKCDKTNQICDSIYFDSKVSLIMFRPFKTANIFIKVDKSSSSG